MLRCLHECDRTTLQPFRDKNDVSDQQSIHIKAAAAEWLRLKPVV